MKRLLSVIGLIYFFLLSNGQTFTVEQPITGVDNLTNIRGQSFIPSIQGAGTGLIGAKDSVYMHSFTIVYSYSSVSEADTLFVYSQLPDNANQLDNNFGGVLIGKSSSKSQEGIYTVYNFNSILLNKDSTYYVMFREDINPEASSGGAYSGGSAIRNTADTFQTSNYLDLRFSATFSRIIDNETNITDIYFDGQIGNCIIDTLNHTVIAEVEKSAIWNSLYTDITLSPGATFQPNFTYFNYSAGPVTLTVTAEDGITSQEWVITVNKEANNQTNLKNFYVSGQIHENVIDTVNHTVITKVDKSKNWENLYTLITLPYGATYQPSKTYFNYAEGPVKISVMAEDNTTIQDWLIIVNKDPNDQTDFLSFYVNNQLGNTVIDTSNSTIHLNVNKGTNLTTLIPSCNLQYGTSIDPATSVETDFSSGQRTYSVMAEDSVTNEEWTVFVTTDDNSYMVDSNLVAYYTFENQVLIDESGNNHHGQVNGPIFIADSGVRGGCFSFDSSFGDIELFNYQPTGSASFNIWYKPTDSENAHRVFHKGRKGGSPSQMWSYSLLYYQNYFRFSIANEAGTGAVNLYSDTTSVPGKWHMITCTFDNEFNLAKLFINGQLMAADTSDNEIPVTSESVKLSNYPNFPGLQWLDGYLDEFSIWQKELSVDEIQYLYNNKSLPMSSLAEIEAFTFYEQKSQTIIDSINQNITITVAHGTSINNLTPVISVSPGATVYPFSGNPVDFTSSPVTFTVTAENLDSIKEWLITVLVEKSNAADIESFILDQQTGPAMINKYNQEIFIEVAQGTDLSKLTPVITISEDANITPDSGETADFSTGPVIYTVTAQDSITKKTWQVCVDVSEPSEINLILPGNDWINVFPNPSEGIIHINFEKNLSEQNQIKILSMDSKTLYTETNIPDKYLSVDLSTLQKGLYILQITDNYGVVYNHKLILTD